MLLTMKVGIRVGYDDCRACTRPRDTFSRPQSLGTIGTKAVRREPRNILVHIMDWMLRFPKSRRAWKSRSPIEIHSLIAAGMAVVIVLLTFWDERRIVALRSFKLIMEIPSQPSYMLRMYCFLHPCLEYDV